MSSFESFSKFARAALTSSRTFGVLFATGMSSVGNFIISVSIARNGSIDDVAKFAIGFAGFVAITGLIRAVSGEPAAARLFDIESIRRGGNAVSAYGFILAIFTVLLGILLNQPYLIAVGIFGHSVAFYDYSKFVSSVFGRPLIAILQETIKTLLVLSILFIPFFQGESFRIFIAWLSITALVGYSSSLIQKIRILPSFKDNKIPPRESISYALDYSLGSGTTQITTFALGYFASPAVNASIRGAGTFFGPVTLIASSVRSLVLPYLSRKLKIGGHLAPSINVSLSLLLATAPVVVAINFIPDSLGFSLLGETWNVTKAVLPILSVEVLTTSLTTIPFAGHRSLGAGNRILVIRTCLAILRLVAIVGAAIMAGFVGAAVAMVSTSTIGLITWWWSYINKMKEVDVQP